jgi:hypothetical protein
MYATGGSVQTAHDLLLHHIGSPEYREQMKHLRYLEELMEHMASGGSAKPAGIQEELDRLKAKMQQETALYNQYIKEHQQTDTKDLPTYESWKQRIPYTGVVKLKDGGQVESKQPKEYEETENPTRVKFHGIGSGGVRSIVVPRHMWEGKRYAGEGPKAGENVDGMREVNKARAEIYGSEPRPPLNLGQITKIHKAALDEHFAKPLEEQRAAEQQALQRLKAAKHIGHDSDTLDSSEKLDTVNNEHGENGKTFSAKASKGVAGYALYTSGHGDNQQFYILNACPGQTEGCGGGVDENGTVDTSKGTCFAPNAESQYVNASVRRASHAQAKHDPAMTNDWILAHTGSLRKAVEAADRANKNFLFRPNVVDESDRTSRIAIAKLNQQRQQFNKNELSAVNEKRAKKRQKPLDELSNVIMNSYGKAGELHDPENGIFSTFSNIGPKVKNGMAIRENINRDQARVGETIRAQTGFSRGQGKDFMNEQGHLTPPKNSYMVTNVKRYSPMDEAMQRAFTHAKYWSAPRAVSHGEGMGSDLTPAELQEGPEGHFDGEGKPTTEDKAHYGHKTIGNLRFDYQRQHIIPPRQIEIKERVKVPVLDKDGNPKKVGKKTVYKSDSNGKPLMQEVTHHIASDSRFLDNNYFPPAQERYRSKNGKIAGGILLTTPTTSTSHVGHHTTFTHHVGEEDIAHAMQNNGEYVVDAPEKQIAAMGKQYAQPQEVKIMRKAEGGSVSAPSSPYHEEEDLPEDHIAFPSQYSEAMVHLMTRSQHHHKVHKKAR